MLIKYKVPFESVKVHEALTLQKGTIVHPKTLPFKIVEAPDTSTFLKDTGLKMQLCLKKCLILKQADTTIT